MVLTYWPPTLQGVQDQRISEASVKAAQSEKELTMKLLLVEDKAIKEALGIDAERPFYHLSLYCMLGFCYSSIDISTIH